jgi:prepilin-type N-terminal cleavage/methylation domain-containing protein
MRNERGFTLLELIIVVAIIGILAAIAIPKMANAVQLSKEGALKGNLGALRGAIHAYYADHEGTFPPDLASLAAGGQYIAKLPLVKEITDHGASDSALLGTAADDAGGWVYNNVTGDPNQGSVQVNCTHTDSKGAVWTTY